MSSAPPEGGDTQAIVRADNGEQHHLKLPVDELVRRVRPLPPHEEMVI